MCYTILYCDMYCNYIALIRTHYFIHQQFSKTFLLDYRFEEVQYLKFSVYDVDSKHQVDNTSLHDFIGESFCTLADIVTAGKQYNKTLRQNGNLFSRNELLQTVNMVCTLHM